MGIFGKADRKPAEGAAKPPAPSAPPPAAAPASTRPAAAACVIGPKTQLKGEIGGSEAVLVECCTLFIFAMETCWKRTAFWSFSLPSCRQRSWALVISVTMPTRRSWMRNGEIGPVGKRNFLHGYTASLALFVKK